jgi:hypothetical protein
VRELHPHEHEWRPHSSLRSLDRLSLEITWT